MTWSLKNDAEIDILINGQDNNATISVKQRLEKHWWVTLKPEGSQFRSECDRISQ